jgi:hypothetical protein
MPIQQYNIYTGKGYAGDLFDSAPRVTQTGIVEPLTLDYGISVKPGTYDRSVVPGADTGNSYGISMRELNHEAANRPSDGLTVYNQTESASIMREGFLLVLVTGANAAVANAFLNVDDVTGAFTGGAAGAGQTASINVRAIESGQVGDIIKVRIDIL